MYRMYYPGYDPCTGKEPEVERDIKKLEKRKDLPDT